MQSKIFYLVLCLCGPFSLLLSRAAEEVCVSCDRKVLASGRFSHGTAFSSRTIEGAPRRGEEAFREDIYGPEFTLSIPTLEPGKYTVQFAFAEMSFTNREQRLFDVTCGEQIIATNFDIFAAAGGNAKVCFLNAEVEHPGDALRGPLTFTFTARRDNAKLNTCEVKDASGRTLFSLRAAALIESESGDVVAAPVVEGPEVWKDSSQPVDARVKDLVRRLSLAEKALQMRNSAPAIPRLGVPAYDYWSECLHGVGRAGVATVFPQAIGLAATWDTALLHDTADVIATEARAKHHEYTRTHEGNAARYFGLTFWTPNINIFRDPRWGRGQETYGEDPFLTSRLGVAFIRGLQGDDPNYIKAMACAKHFAVHSGPEPDRHRFDAIPSERDLYETYLPHFEAAVREGHVGAVMGAYNRVLGEPACSSSFLLTELLRKKWGFNGHVVSDCGAIYDIFANHKIVPTSEEASARAVKAGCDLCCGTDYNSLTRAVKRGLITPAEIDTAVGRLFEARFHLGLFDPPEKVPYARIPLSQNDTPEHEALARRAAVESIVLLRNDRLLPLDRARLRRIVVIGTNANSVPMLLGNYNGTPARPVTILDGIKAAAGPRVEVLYEPGCPLALRADGVDGPDRDAVARAVATAKVADVVIYVGGINPRLEGEEMRVDYDGFVGGDRTRIELPAVQTELLKALQATGKPVVFVNCSGSAMAMPWEAEHLPAILQAWYPGEQGGSAVADVLFGNADPSGRLPVTFYRATDDLPAFDNYSMSNRTYRYFAGKPLFAFGHGLSYTTFKFADATLASTRVISSSTLKLRFGISNDGRRPGCAVPQVYFRHVNSMRPQAKLELCSFARIEVPPNAAAWVNMEIPVERFRNWDLMKEQYAVEPGEYELLIGASSDDIRLRVRFTVVTR